MAGSTQSGSYSMPIDMYLKKMEMTCIGNQSVEDDMETLNNYNRQQLIDFREPKSQFEEDAPRYDNHSRERLSLRHHGNRSEGVQPWLPDGTFLDQIFLSDKGTSDLPNFQDLRSQIELRVRDKALYSDEDYSIPTKERSASQHIQVRDQVHEQARKRFQIFDTSKDYLMTSNTTGKPLMGGSQLKKLIHDQTPGFMSQEAANRSNWQVDYSNTTPVGWQTTPDTVYKVSRYDAPRKMADQTIDSYNNRAGGRLDTDFLVSLEGRNIPRSLALTIMEIMRQRKRVSDFTKNTGTQYAGSTEDVNRKLKQLDAQMTELMRRYSDQSAATPANQMINSERKNVSGMRYIQRDDPNKIHKSLVGLQLVEMIKQATHNRKLGKQNSDDLRNQIIQTASTDAIHNTAINSRLANTSGSNQVLWESLAQHKRDEQMAVFNYAGVQPGTRGQMAGSHNMFVVDEYDRLKHPDISNRRVITDNNLYAPDVLSYEQNNILDVPMWNLGGAVKGQSGIGMTTQDNRYDNDMSDISSMMYSQPGRINSQ